MKAVFITRSDISWYAPNGTPYRKVLDVVSHHETTLCVSTICRVPPEIESKASAVVRFHCVFDLLRRGLSPAKRGLSSVVLFTGFDFPSMAVAAVLKRRWGAAWTVFCWDPPSLSHRDRFPPLRWAIDGLFRWFVRRCDHLVLNIHPGLLREVGFSPREIDDGRASGRLELQMQDAFAGLTSESLPPCEADDGAFDYDVGVLSNWSVAKGGPLVSAALRERPALKCLWIGDPPRRTARHPQVAFAGRLAQAEAFARLKRCRVLLVPYLPVRSLKWNYVLKIFEYLQLGRPVLASDNPGNAAVAARFPGRVALFRSGDAADLAARLCRIVPETSKRK